MMDATVNAGWLSHPSSKLIKGDCVAIMQAAVDINAHLIFADLPYGCTSQNLWDKQLDLAELWKQFIKILADGGAVVFTATQPFASSLVTSNPTWFRYELVWDKRTPTGHLNAKRQPMRQHENVLIFAKKSARYNPQMRQGKPFKKGIRAASSNYGAVTEETKERVYSGDRYPTSILSFPSARGLHPTQKPTDLLQWIISTYTNAGDTVFDPTMGSGTTGVACARLGRHFIGIEKDQNYFQVASERIKSERLALGLT